MRQPVETTTDIFAFFRNLNFIRNKKGFELKVLAVVLDAFGLSLSEGKPRASLVYFQNLFQSRM
ncbi:hypothetical protein B9Q03_12830 [Candidatus Marsarchaeota G2 archaeon OSP_D]|jgi:hypothetical protein|uniref:Uncharacterized protein n=5 Tax=Candidatus Marsarchaeota group 2 TaxID=2203771 RepID=A0A2R6B710_9ARCH|nr:MAG: hypothetical protein B9Q03_12830 [Candidatus Marsarchaeota G2 archaeon OSP_D]PSN93397.1 MAG: hypothetical protein B9Q06_12090 [Candidatus Marsarchaeota G2 archaeon ECH_B_2]PSN97790.1 MAG: hypothetical protein B9Q07_11395 [Candidatus Marsarchaeota G2 archaeon ECH_B_3]PSO01503.1 MAG: hypothetical protein B9Q05_08655 [Candidatus Marsarchaeota G2 archaeon ECH_B_1]PSO06495.1 MAG: hypothetical protein B9Q04_15740 [Candidatus Marsarchaeota G2 archaeon BE_D]